MRKLSEAAAAVIALKWATRLIDLAGHYVGLTDVYTGLLPVLNVWVEGKHGALEVDKDALAALRETLGVWRAVACCRGFSGYENPRFWDKVVRQFVIDNNGEMEETSRHDFHDEAASPSCVTLKVSIDGLVCSNGRNKTRVRAWMREICRELFQLSDVEKAPLSAEYQRVLRQLQPFMDEQRFARESITAELTLQSGKDGRAEYTDPDMLETYAAILNEIAAKSTRDAPVETPLLTMRYASFAGVTLSTKREVQAFTTLMARNPYPIDNMCPMFGDNVDPGAMSQFLTTILQTKELSASRSVVVEDPPASSQGKLEALTFIFSTANRHPLACFFSALPYARSLQTLRLMEIDWEWTKFECYWMAYVCFHPRSKSSSWRDLCLLLAKMTDEARDVFVEIQQDPSRALSVTRLAVVMEVVSTSEARSDRLQIATVDKGATIYIRSNVQAGIVMTLSEEAEFEMCDLLAHDWHCVLVPGYGFGWAQASDVIGTRDWIPEGPLSSSLKVLEVPSTFSVEDALLVVSLLGSSVESLKLRQGCSSGSILEKLALRCPSLKSLELGTRGEQLSQHSLKRFFSQATGKLESLSIDYESCNAPVLMKILSESTQKAGVKRLKRLFLKNLTRNLCGPTQMASLERMLQTNQSLEQLYFQINDAHCGWDMRTPGADLEKHNGEDICRNQHTKQRLAFLSVVKRHREEHQEHQALDSTVLARIFDFAIAPVRRLVLLPPALAEY
ncbi:hypothetical protein Gpo141_00010433 [Globisporangium polare]